MHDRTWGQAFNSNKCLPVPRRPDSLNDNPVEMLDDTCNVDDGQPGDTIEKVVTSALIDMVTRLREK